MVTRAGKELLKNTMNTVKLHNRIIEENEMWKQWELERGLTMMVSDDVFKTRHKNGSCAKKRCYHKHRHRGQNSTCSSSQNRNLNTEKWDHGGFEELYPDNYEKSPPSTSKKNVSSPRHARNNEKNSQFEEICSDSEEIWKEFRSFKKKKSKNFSVTSKACKSRFKYQKKVMKRKG